MVNRNLIRNLESDDSLASLIDNWVQDASDVFEPEIEREESVELNKIVEGTILRVDDEFVLIDVGGKSEGSIPRDEWDEEEEDAPKVGDKIKVLVEDIEDEFGRTDDPHGMITLSKRKAEKIIDWDRTMATIQEGNVVEGTVVRKIKGGLLVDIGVNVFLPASQVDIRRPSDIADYIGKKVECEVLKIDEERRNIVVSRRSLIEKKRQKDRDSLLQELQVGQRRKGVVKNIADFGAFVDLGGIDGLLHITDMSWGRIGHPTEVVKIDDEVEVQILNIDHERQKIALGMKQMQPSPWDGVEAKYPVGAKVRGQVVNVMSYGAFVKLEEGIEGLVHISEMSWTKRISHPSEVVNIGDEIDVVVLGINKEKQEISLGMKQTQSNPWENIKERYPVESIVKGKVRNLTNYGAFVELEEGIDGLLHVSDMSWTRKIGHPSEMLEKGQEVECKVLNIEEDRRRIALGLKQMDLDPWASSIPDKYQPNQLVKGKVTKITNFGVFVGLEDGLEGLLHISELADEKVENPEDVVKVGDDIEVKILRVDTDERKIGLSRKRVQWAAEDEAAAAAAEATVEKEQQELKGGLGSSGPLFSTGAAADSESEEG
ncbi:30S ribosomal protein S1 [Blastopirellula marina]|uniref:30S ribosomal protein S1 n=1 Tax=Blastopirellula marina TaxID=124 RepID=A0A2S8GAA0_9BACT|nr:30S ribosomal protein S1 [Blastopirellula marina]PQO35471.1 30S ribosomal protein S1 [Blastopirellula marina]PQO41357.1 30S ribosomal protein S1 [Blastopirellula marina]PTL44111.1 30S ribosomal protein S1 [Blastopirellula marina]